MTTPVKTTPVKHIGKTAIYIVSNLYFASFLLLFLTHADMAFGGRKFDLLPVSPTDAFILFSIPAIFALFVEALVNSSLRKRIVFVLKQNKAIVGLLSAIVFCSLFFSVFSQTNWAPQQDTASLTLYALFVSLVSLLLPLFRVVQDNYKRYIFLCWFASLTALTIDLIFPGTFSNFDTRAAGLEADSNTSAFLIITFCGLFIDYRRIRPLDLMALSLTLISVILSASRSGIILFGVLLMFYLFFVLARQKMKPFKIVSLFVGSAALALVIKEAIVFAFRNSPVFLAGTQNRLTSIPGDDPRIVLLKQYIDWIVAKPFVGYGTGFAETQVDGAHNMYLQLWVNNGIAGFLFYFLLVVVTGFLFYRRQFLPGLLFSLELGFYSLFSHDIMRTRSIFMLLGTLATLSLLQRSANRKPLNYPGNLTK